MRLDKRELIHPIFYLLFIGVLSTPSIVKIFHNTLEENLKLIPYLILFYIIFNLLQIAECVDVRNDEIVSGVYVNHIGFLKIKKRILLKDISEIKLHQNEKKYMEIRAFSRNDEFLIIKTIANRIPAEKELEEIILKIKKWPSNTSSKQQ